MSSHEALLIGEHRRTLDQRYRLSIPPEFSEQIQNPGPELILAKERPGCLSLWNADPWESHLNRGITWVADKLKAGKLEQQTNQLLQLGRLLSTRHVPLQLAGRGRLVIPEGFREFLDVKPGDALFVVGASVCVELWHPQRWVEYLNQQMPEFRELFDELSN
ncbi:MAG: division/cell wall cluster transcriptional repressor MraZ [Pirellulaceae bacterium]|jgi:MraZ protein|nr:division/cell wall cluster transcriptional repressor MraZ [Planctomycetaceae bacterium]MBT6722220.1 division/cell wall cluster transcriptional repressor MraZ [Planctomycetaceae bacterium]MDB4862871.1 division/cell wall cluster transcriptional repressor MraZ [Pirellulaceae bacterium]